MDASATYRLTIRQRWQLALSVFMLYWPIRLYVNILEFNPSFLLKIAPFLLLEVVFTVLFFFIWISVMEWLSEWLFDWFGDGSIVEVKLPAQLITLLVAIGLAIAFNSGFYLLRHSVDIILQNPAPVVQANAPNRPTSAQTRNSREQRQRVNHGITVMAMLSAFYLAANLRSNKRRREIQVRAERLEKENVQAQFSALKNQVSPHFLFNSLSILSSLVDVDPKLSRQFIDRLSRAYRYILEQKDNDRVLLRTELEFIEAYTFLLKIRFDEKLDVLIDVPDADATRYSIAPLTLQLLVENAVKHNQMSAREPLVVSITLKDNCLIVSNPIRLRPKTDLSTGIGLQNIINRYSLLADTPVRVDEQDGRFVVTIPLLA